MSEPLIPGTPWGTDVLVEPPDLGWDATLGLDLPWEGTMRAGNFETRGFDRTSLQWIGERVVAALQEHDYGPSHFYPVTKLHHFTVPGMRAPANVLIAEKDLRLDRTRTKRNKILSVILGLGLVAFILVTVLGYLSSLGVILALVFTVTIAALLILSLTEAAAISFWSRVIYAVVGTAVDRAGSAAQPGDQVLVGFYGGVGRSENWHAKGMAGRTIHRVYPSASVQQDLQLVVADLSQNATLRPGVRFTPLKTDP